MGSPIRDRPPSRIITIEMTMAMVGCLMKKLDMALNHENARGKREDAGSPEKGGYLADGWASPSFMPSGVLAFSKDWAPMEGMTGWETTGL